MSSGQFIKQLRILLHCMMMQAVDIDIEARKRFQEDIGSVAESLHDEIAEVDLDTTIAKAVRALEEYNRQASDSFHAQAAELRNLLNSMAETIVFMGSGTETSMEQLGLVQSKLQQAIRLQDPRQMRGFMQESLALVLRETKRIQSESRAKTAALGAEVERLQTLLKSAKLVASDDPTTGLPARAAAEQAIESLVAARKEFTVALFVIDRLVTINGRFGRLVGDQVLLHAATTLAGRLRSATLYRWSGPCFLAIFDPSINATVAETYAKQAASFRVEKEFQIGERNAFVVIAATLHLHRVGSNMAPSSVIDSIDSHLVSSESDGK